MSESLQSLFPDAEELLKLEPEDLAPILLRIALPQQQSAGFIPSAVTQISVGDLVQGHDYPFYKKQPVEQLLNRTWNWIERQGLIEPAPGISGMIFALSKSSHPFRFDGSFEFSIRRAVGRECVVSDNGGASGIDDLQLPLCLALEAVDHPDFDGDPVAAHSPR